MFCGHLKFLVIKQKWEKNISEIWRKYLKFDQNCLPVEAFWTVLTVIGLTLGYDSKNHFIELRKLQREYFHGKKSTSNFFPQSQNQFYTTFMGESKIGRYKFDTINGKGS